MVVPSYPCCTSIRRAAFRIFWRVAARSRSRRARLGIEEVAITALNQITSFKRVKECQVLHSHSRGNTSRATGVSSGRAIGVASTLTALLRRQGKQDLPMNEPHPTALQLL